MIYDKLYFKLPSFKRITWVSEELQAKWEPIINCLPQIIESVFNSIEIANLIQIQIKSISMNDLFGFKKQIISKGLFAEQVDNLPNAIRLYFGLRDEKNKSYVIVGNRHNVIQFIKVIKELKYDIIINHIHSETFFNWDKFSSKDLTDDIWNLLNITDGTVDKLSSQPNNLLNPCWKSLGISSIPFAPASLNCEHSLEIATIIQSHAREILSNELYNAWYEILSWPVEWSALHGIAEIKTPIFKMIYNTDATGSKYVLQLESDTYPQNGLNGLLFPYKKPKKLFFSNSKQNISGIMHLSETLNATNFKTK